MKNFAESERYCQVTFQNTGACYFVSTSGKDTPLLFSTRDDFVFVMNVIAQASASFPDMRIIAFEVMDNHFHFMIACDSESIIEDFFLAVKKRLVRHFPNIRHVELDIRPIHDLNSIRNHIVYTHRNGACTSLICRFGSGCGLFSYRCCSFLRLVRSCLFLILVKYNFPNE